MSTVWLPAAAEVVAGAAGAVVETDTDGLGTSTEDDEDDGAVVAETTESVDTATTDEEVDGMTLTEEVVVGTL